MSIFRLLILVILVPLSGCDPFTLCGLGGGCGSHGGRDIGLTPLHEAAERGDVERVKELIAAGADMQARTQWGYLPILSAGKNGHLDVMRVILDAGFDPNSRNPFGGTILHAFTVYGTPKGAALLIDRGADVNARDESGQLPIHWASYRGTTDMVRLLVARGADLNAYAPKVGTPLGLALAHRKHINAAILERAGAKELPSN